MPINWNAAWRYTVQCFPTIKQKLEQADIGEWKYRIKKHNYPPRITVRFKLIPSDQRRALVQGRHAKHVTDDELRQISIPIGNIAMSLNLKAKRFSGDDQSVGVVYKLTPKYDEFRK